MGKKEKKTILTFARREGRPSDSIRYKKGRRTPSARMRKVMSRWITKRWRRGEYTSGTYSRRREGESSSALTIGMFSGFDTGERRGMEGKRRKKKRKTARARIYRVTLSGLFQRQPPNWYCRHLLRRDLLSKALARGERAHIFPRIHSTFLSPSFPLF